MFELKLLDYPKILNKLSDLSIIDKTKEDFFSLVPSNDKDMIQRRLNEAYEAKNILYRLGPLDLYNFRLEDIIERVRISAPLSVSEFLEINKLIMNASVISTYFKGNEVLNEDYPYLTVYTSKIVSLKECRDLIGNVLDFEGNIIDNASPELYKIRKTLKQLENDANTKLNQIIREQASKLSEGIITLRNGHRVLPVKSDYRNQIKGIVYDESSSGQTIYIEPYAVSEIENRITILSNEEKNEIKKILLKLSNDVSAYYEPIKTDYEIVLNIDEIFARGMYAKEINAEMVTISDDLNYMDARHPLIDKDKIVPNTISLSSSKKTMIITGPNTGGKTVVLKTVGLLSLMLQSGILLPVKEGSSAPVFDGIYADIGDEQSIEQSLSTFSSHMTRISRIINELEDNSLVLLDELGSGTDPKEGASLAISILDYLRSKNTYSITTTHYPELKLYAYKNFDIENASVEFDVNTLKPTYKLLMGVSGGSNAFLISERLGLNKDIIENAKSVNLEFKDSESDLIHKLESDSKELARLKEEYSLKIKEAEESVSSSKSYYRKEKEKLEKRRQEIEAERTRILEKAQNDATSLLDEIKALEKDIRKKKEVKEDRIAKLRGEANSIYETAEIKKNYSKKEIHTGDNVRVIEYNKVGIVTGIKNDKYTVALGALSQVFNKEDLEYVEIIDQVKKITDSKKKSGSSNLKTNIHSRLDLRGMRYEEAKDELEKFMDDAVLGNLETVEIIHGFGTLALRNMVLDYCKTHKEVKSYRPGEEHEGGRGVTVVSLK